MTIVLARVYFMNEQNSNTLNKFYLSDKIICQIPFLKYNLRIYPLLNNLESLISKYFKLYMPQYAMIQKSFFQD